MKNIDENTKITLTLGQIKELIRESFGGDKEPDSITADPEAHVAFLKTDRFGDKYVIAVDPIVGEGDYTNPDLEESFEDDMRGQGFDVTLDLSHESNDRISEREVRRLLPRMIKAYPPEDYFYTFGTVTVNGGNPSHEDVESALATAFNVGDIIDSLGDNEEEDEEEDNKRKIKSAYSVSSNGAAIFPKSLKEIAEEAFKDRKTLKTAQIPDSVTAIKYKAFYYCSGLTSVTIPASVTSIGNLAFSHCSGLTSITIPDSMMSIGRGAFWGCSGLTSITIPDSVTSIEDDAFRECSGVTSITIGSGVTSIGECAFAHCSGLKSVVIPDSVTSIEDDAFYGCSSLTSVTIPARCRIGEEAFPKGVKIIRRR